MSELSVVERMRVFEYQQALRRARAARSQGLAGDDPLDEVEDACGKLLALDIDPAEARRLDVGRPDLEGDW